MRRSATFGAILVVALVWSLRAGGPSSEPPDSIARQPDPIPGTVVPAVYG